MNIFNFDRAGENKVKKNYRENSVNTSRVMKKVSMFSHPLIGIIIKFVLPVMIISFLSGGFAAIIISDDVKRNQFFFAVMRGDLAEAWNIILTKRYLESAYYFTGNHPHLSQLAKESGNQFWVTGFANVASPIIGNIAVTKDVIMKYQLDQDKEECFENQNGNLIVIDQCKTPAVGLTPDEMNEYCENVFSVKIGGLNFLARLATEKELKNIFMAPIARGHINSHSAIAEITGTNHSDHNEYHKIFMKRSTAKNNLMRASEYPGYIENDKGRGLTSLSFRCVIPIPE